MAERPVRALKFQGLGLRIWMWPLVNILLERLGTTGLRRASPLTGKGTYNNTEEWMIREMPDGSVKMIIHRKAQRG